MSQRIRNFGQQDGAAEIPVVVIPARWMLASASRKRPCAKPRVFHNAHGDIGRRDPSPLWKVADYDPSPVLQMTAVMIYIALFGCRIWSVSPVVSRLFGEGRNVRVLRGGVFASSGRLERPELHFNDCVHIPHKWQGEGAAPGGTANSTQQHR